MIYIRRNYCNFFTDVDHICYNAVLSTAKVFKSGRSTSCWTMLSRLVSQVFSLYLQIKEIIKEGITVPDAENDLRRQQLRELALLNGTLRENDALS